MPHPRVGWVVFAAAFAVGCEPAGPVLHPVAGGISVNGRPLPSGSVSFRPDPPTAAAHHPTGSITDGRYELFTVGKPGAPPGRYKVLVFSDANAAGGTSAHPKPPAWQTDGKYTSEQTTDLRAEVVAAPEPGRYDLKLTK